MIGLLERSYISTPTEYRPVEFAQKAMFFALDVTCELGFGSAPGYLVEDKDLYDYLAINDAFFPVIIVMSNFPWLARLTHRWPLKHSLPKAGDTFGFGALMRCEGLYLATLQPEQEGSRC